MTQLRLQNFFNPNSKQNKTNKSGGVFGDESGAFTPTHNTLFDFDEPENDNKTDVISFHSFTVHKSFEGRGLMNTRMSTAADVVENYCPSDGKPRLRKISEFNDSLTMDDKIGPGTMHLSFPTAAQIPPTNFLQSQPVEDLVVTRTTRRDSQVLVSSSQPHNNLSDWLSKPAPLARMPFSQLVSKTQQILPAAATPSAPVSKSKVTRNLDDFFKQSILVSEAKLPTEVMLGKRTPDEENQKGTEAPVIPLSRRKYRPMDNFVIRIKRNNHSNCVFIKMGIDVTSRIMRYLTLTENARLSRVCHFLSQSYKSAWTSPDFFGEMDLSKYSSIEIRRIQQKSKLPHNRTVLGSLFRGKNIEMFLKKNRVSFASAPEKQLKKGLISKFEVSPIKGKGGAAQNTLVTDKDITQILQTSFKTLTYCNLVSCMFISKVTFNAIAQAHNLQWLCISNNQNLDDECAVEIVKNCRDLLHLSFSRCTRLTENTTDAITENLLKLESLDISGNTSMISNFRNPASLRNLTNLHELDLSGCAFTDYKLLSACRYLPSLEVLNVVSCSSAPSVEVLREILLKEYCTIRKVDLRKSLAEKTEQEALANFVSSLQTYHRPIEIIFHREETSLAAN